MVDRDPYLELECFTYQRNVAIFYQVAAIVDLRYLGAIVAMGCYKRFPELASHVYSSFVFSTVDPAVLRVAALLARY